MKPYRSVKLLEFERTSEEKKNMQKWIKRFFWEFDLYFFSSFFDINLELFNKILNSKFMSKKLKKSAAQTPYKLVPLCIFFLS